MESWITGPLILAADQLVEKQQTASEDGAVHGALAGRVTVVGLVGSGYPRAVDGRADRGATCN